MLLALLLALELGLGFVLFNIIKADAQRQAHIVDEADAADCRGDEQLLVAATIGGVRLIDNVGLPLGIGFNNIEEHEAKAELEREQQREQQRAQGTASQQPSED